MSFIPSFRVGHCSPLLTDGVPQSYSQREVVVGSGPQCDLVIPARGSLPGFEHCTLFIRDGSTTCTVKGMGGHQIIVQGRSGPCFEVSSGSRVQLGPGGPSLVIEWESASEAAPFAQSALPSSSGKGGLEQVCEVMVSGGRWLIKCVSEGGLTHVLFG